MKRLAMILLLSSLLSPAAFAGAVNTYQVTGPVLSVTDTAIVVKKGNEKWEIARTKDTKVKGTLKVGAKVTVHYRMQATSVEVKK